MSRSITLMVFFLFACEAYSQDETKKDPVGLILIAQDLNDATRLMTVYDLDEDEFVDKGEMEKLSWRDGSAGGEQTL